MRRHFLSLISLLLVTGSLAHAQNHRFNANARLTQAAVKNGTDFPVVTTVRNISGKRQTFEVLSCAFPVGWITGNPRVHIDGGGCLQSARGIIKLQSGKAYTQTFEVYVDLDLPANRNQQEATFRLGYPASGPHLNSKSPQTIWSNPVTITVTRDSPLNVQTKLTQAEIGDLRDMNVIASLRNVTKTDQVLRIEKCMYENKWTSDNPHLQVNPYGCPMGTSENITLEPGQAYTQPVSVHAVLPPGKAPRVRLTFRLGYDPDEYASIPKPSKKSILWSSPVTITVTRDPAAAH
jgi:hypothetical protein